MSATQIALLGAIAGFAIVLGLPVGRVRNPAPWLQALFKAAVGGILLFLLRDGLAHASGAVDAALGKHGYGPAAGDGLVMAAGAGIGLLGLLHFDQWVTRRRTRAATASPTPADGEVARWSRPLIRLPNIGHTASGATRAVHK